MKPFLLSITKSGRLSIVCPKCGSKQVEVTNYPENQIDKIKCRHCGNTIYRPLPQKNGYHQITIDELNKEDDEEQDEIREHTDIQL